MSDEYTELLTPEHYDFVHENGRRYHARCSGQYFMPNDEQEQDRMHLLHHISSKILKGGLCRAPVHHPRKILDIGTGTGIWAIEAADKFPEAEVIATDLSPIQSEWIPPNLEFWIDDGKQPLRFPHKFDLIHVRNMGGSIADWLSLMLTCFDNLEPGGWLEVSDIGKLDQHESNVSCQSTNYWQNTLGDAASLNGCKLDIAPDLFGLLFRAGFMKVGSDTHELPLWSEKDPEHANLFRKLALDSLEALSLRLFTTKLRWTPKSVRLLLTKVENEIKNPETQMFFTMHYIYGQKPLLQVEKNLAETRNIGTLVSETIEALLARVYSFAVRWVFCRFLYRQS